MRAGWIAFAVAFAFACDGDDTGDGEDSLIDPACAEATAPPSSLACTGLFADLKAKRLARDVTPFAPAVPLWSDGAEKTRWILLPRGTTIDASNRSEWKFPVGTKAWKEFKVGGRRVETRLFEKVNATTWVNGTYAWNADETAAVLTRGGDISLPDGATYHIPTGGECQQCHRGRNDRLLGFEEVSLGLPGATGYTLAKLVEEKRLAPPPARTDLVLADDGTGAATVPMAWLHVNCGVTCHNTNSSAIGYAAKMNLRLDPAELDGRSSVDFGVRTTTVGVPAVTPRWSGEPRILPGDPEQSILFQLVSRRGAQQMPPIASRVVDAPNVEALRAWILALPHPPTIAEDAGAPDAGPADAGEDASSVDAGADADAAPMDAGADAEAPTDAGDAGDAADADAAP